MAKFDEKDLAILLRDAKDPAIKKRLGEFMQENQGLLDPKKAKKAGLPPPVVQPKSQAPRSQAQPNVTPLPQPLPQRTVPPPAPPPPPPAPRPAPPPPPMNNWQRLRNMAGTVNRISGIGNAASKMGSGVGQGIKRGFPGFLKTALLGDSNTVLNKPFDSWSRAWNNPGGPGSKTPPGNGRYGGWNNPQQMRHDANKDAKEERLQAITEENAEQQKSQLVVLKEISSKLDKVVGALEINGKQVGALAKASGTAQGGDGLINAITGGLGSLFGGKLLGKAGGALGKVGGAGRKLLSKIPGLGKLLGAGGAAIAAEKVAEHSIPAAAGAAEKAGVKLGEKGLLKGALSMGRSALASSPGLLRRIGGGLLKFGTEAGGLAIDTTAGAWKALHTDSDVYARRLGMKNAPNSLLGDIGVRTAGTFQDAGNAIHDGFGSLVNLGSNLFGGGDLMSSWTDETAASDYAMDPANKGKPAPGTLSSLITGDKGPAPASTAVPAAGAALAAAGLMQKAGAGKAAGATVHAAEGALGHAAGGAGRFDWLRKGGKALGKYAPLLATAYFSGNDLLKKDEEGNAKPDWLGAGMNTAAGASSFIFERSRNPLLRWLGPMLEAGSAGIHGKEEYSEEKEHAAHKRHEIEQMMKEGKLSKEEGEKQLKESEFNPKEAASHIGQKVLTHEFLPKFMAESLPEILHHAGHGGLGKSAIFGGIAEYAKKSPKLLAALLGGTGVGLYASHAQGETEAEGEHEDHKDDGGHAAAEHHEEKSDQHDEAVKKANEVKAVISKNTDALKGHVAAIKTMAPKLDTERKDAPDSITTDPTSAISTKNVNSMVASMLSLMADKTKGIFVRMAEDTFDAPMPQGGPGPATTGGGSGYHDPSTRTPENTFTRVGGGGTSTAPTGNAAGGKLSPSTPMTHGLGAKGSSDIVAGSSDTTMYDALLAGESKKGAAGYDDFWGGAKKYGTPEQMFGKPVSQLTFGQIKEWQKKTLQAQKAAGIDQNHRSSAIGKGQFISGTLKAMQEKAGLSDDDLFDVSNQNKLIGTQLNDLGLQKWQNGQMDDKKFASNLASTWASVKDFSGSGHYEGIGQTGTVGPQAILNSLTKASLASSLTPAGQAVSPQINGMSNDIAQQSGSETPTVVPVSVPVPTATNQQPASSAGLQATSMTTRNDDSAIKALTLNFLWDSFPLG